MTADSAFRLAPGTLENYPGPAVLVDSDGGVHELNGEGAVLAAALVEGSTPRLAEALDHTLTDAATRIEGVALPSEWGETPLQITILPLAGGGALLLASDMSLERNFRQALSDSRQRYKDLVDASSDFAWETDRVGNFIFVSPRGALGWTPEALVGRPAAEFLAVPLPEGQPLPFAAHHRIEQVDVWLRRADGGDACVSVAALPLAAQDGTWRGARGVCRDVTDERRRDTVLAGAVHRERLLSYILRTMRDEIDPSLMLDQAAAAIAGALGAGCRLYRIDPGAEPVRTGTEGEGPGDDGSLLAQVADEGALAAARAEEFSGLAVATRYRQQVNGAVCLWRPAAARPWTVEERELLVAVAGQLGIANEQIVNHQRIVSLSRTDALTGLLNRRAFFEELGRRVGRLAVSGQCGTLIYVDLDNFKTVNDVRGHQGGDEALLALRDLLLQNSRAGDLVARLGGDEFALWIEGAGEEAAARRAAALLKASQSLRLFSGAPDRPLGFSLGVAVSDPARPESLENLLSRADTAMYDVKHGGKGDAKLAPPPPAPTLQTSGGGP